MASLTFSKACKCYAGQEENAVSELDLEIVDGEFIAFVGPSGCGKSTALRMVAGLEDISSGEIRIGDQVINDVPPQDRDIAMVFQSYALYPHMTVQANLGFAMKIRKEPKEAIASRIESVSSSLGLEKLLKRKPGQLSGGQRQRVALGRAIVRDPEVFLMDEPLSNLDAKLRVQTRLEIMKLHKELGTTFLYVTHDQIEAMTMGDRIVVLRDGVVQQVDTPAALYAAPVNAFVAGFIGSPAMNFIPAAVDGDTTRLVGENFELELTPELLARHDLHQDQSVLVGIRPEHLIDDRFAEPALPRVPATVELLEVPGSDIFAHLNLGGRRVNARMDTRSADLQPGQPIEVAVNTEHLHVFDATSEISLAATDRVQV